MNPEYRRWMMESILNDLPVPSVYGPKLYPGEFANPPKVKLGSKSIPVVTSKGNYHHVRVADPKGFVGIYTKTLSEAKGIKARVGRSKKVGPRGGSTKIVSYLLDASRYSPEDVIAWVKRQEIKGVKKFDFTSKGKKTSKRKVAKRKTSKRKTSKRKTAKRKSTRKTK